MIKIKIEFNLKLKIMKTLLKALYKSEINILIDWMWDSGIQVKIGDRMNGFVAVELFDIEDFDKIENWIEENVKEHFPNSTFSKTYNPKYCMPDGINSKEEHEQYLKDIGYNDYLKELEEIFSDIPDSKNCKSIVEAYLIEKLEKLKNILER